MEQVKTLAERAAASTRLMARMTVQHKNNILDAIARALLENVEFILAENKRDIQRATREGMPAAMIDRLLLDEKRISGMAAGLRKVAALPDPVGEVLGGGTLQSGISMIKKRVPLGVVGIIYEARPNVTADAIGLCLKTGNCALLKGGKEAIHSNIAIVKVAKEAGQAAGMPEGAIELVEDTSREAAASMMRLNGLIDVLIPRGGAGLIQAVVQQATVPVIETGTGNCHVFVDESADQDMATRIVVNAKTSRPSVCNAIETLLVHERIAAEFLPEIFTALREKQVEIRGCEVCLSYDQAVIPATEQDYEREFLDYVIAVKVVKNLDEALSHIAKYGTKHSEAIITRDYANAGRFQEEVDAAAVYVNASTRFTDGEEFGFGAEIGISTQKLHARGPMGLKELTTYKYILTGDGQIR